MFHDHGVTIGSSAFWGDVLYLDSKNALYGLNKKHSKVFYFEGPLFATSVSLMNDCFLSTQIDDCFGSSSLLHELALFLQVSTHSLLKRPTPRSLQM